MVDPEFDLIIAIAHGDHEAFERLVRRYQSPLHNFLARYLEDRGAAEDLAQEVFLKVHQMAPRFIPKGRVSSWIFKIAYNLAQNELKRRSRLRRMVDHEWYREGAAYRGSTEAAAQREVEEEFMAALHDLSEDQRAALQLRVAEELSYREISEIMGASVQSVESLLFRARKRLRQSLGRAGQAE
jgi:RNA polymerase sigma-70 factor, ECF subfamily